ncbi:integrase catalytic domain-containing protein [Trichonephila clavipes]|uniref:Integrase catalytic domain-containing protein n=1 Tax=Trichonephila clavipes TaxID=2585209 RepID=A0A8X6UT98_TRICX|nr:integrase catalytic domain-containing protein [Trichonephila clavipes]
MKSAFNQIPLHFADRHKTAFSTPDGDKYQFNRLCFGLKNSPKAFQSIAQEVLGDLLHHGALVYIDDIILFTKTIDEHFELLGRKFKVFTDHNPLAGFLSNKNLSSKILRWKLALEEFNYDIHYIRGSLNSVADHLSRYINNITIALPDSKDLINRQREDSVLSTIIQKIDQNDVSPQISNYFINGEGLLCHLSKRPSRSPRSNTTRKQTLLLFTSRGILGVSLTPPKKGDAFPTPGRRQCTHKYIMVWDVFWEFPAFWILVQNPKRQPGMNFNAAAGTSSASRGNEDLDMGLEREAFPHYFSNIRQKYESF